MALRRSRLTLIFIYVILFFALCAKPISSHGKEDAPSPTPSEDKDEDKESENDSDTPGAAPSSGPSADSPLSVSELFELSMPEIGVEKSSTGQNNDATKMAITQLEGMKQYIEAYKTWFAAKKTCGQTPPEAKKCCDKCQKNLDDAINGVKVSIESINKQDVTKANGDISGIAKDIQTCTDCFVKTGNGEDQGVKNFNVWAKGATEVCLKNLKVAETGVKKLSELFELSMPEIGVEKSSTDQNNDATKMAIAQLEGMKQYIEAHKTWFTAKKTCGQTPPEAKKCCDKCQKNLDDAINGVKVSIESINKQDVTKANGDISGIAKDIQICTDCFVKTGNGEDPGVKNFNVWAKGTTEVCLKNLKVAEIGVKKLSELFENSMPEIGVQKSSTGQNNDATKMAIAQLEGMKQYIEAHKTWFAAKKTCGQTPPEAKTCCDKCQKNLDDAINGVKVSIESINKQDVTKANGDISGIAKDIQICTDCFVKTGNGEDPGVKNFNVWAKGTTEVCLKNLKVAEIGVKKLSVDQNNDDTKLTITQLEDIKQIIEGFKTSLSAKMKCNKTPLEAKKCCDQCEENLDAAIDGVKESMESINKHDLPKANVDISGITTEIETCNDCFPNEDKDVKAFYLGVKGITEKCLQNLKKAEIGVQKSSVDQNNDGTKVIITQVEDIKQRIESFKAYLTAKKNCNKTPPEAKECCDLCQGNLDDAMKDVKVSMESINKQDLPRANNDISGIFKDIQTCHDCFVETRDGVDSYIKNYYLGINGVTEGCIHLLKKATTGVQKIGVRKSSIDQNNDGTKMTITQLEGIEQRIEAFKTFLPAKKNCNLTPPEAKKCCDQCQENLDDAIDGVKVSIESINKQDLPKANVDINGIATDIQTCNDCFPNGEDKDVKPFNLWVQGVIKECLDNIKNA